MEQQRPTTPEGIPTADVLALEIAGYHVELDVLAEAHAAEAIDHEIYYEERRHLIAGICRASRELAELTLDA
jgi:hypothetical protein